MTRRFLAWTLGALVLAGAVPAAAQPDEQAPEPETAGDPPDPDAEPADPDPEQTPDVDDASPPVDEPLEATPADPEPESDADPEPAAEPEPEPAAEPEAEPAAEAVGPPFTLTGPILPRSYLEWPAERVLRPVTLPRGTWALGLDLRSRVDFDSAAVAAGLAEVPGRSGLWFAFGLTDQAEFDLAYSLSLKSFEPRGTLEVGSAFNLVRDAVIDVSARAGLGWNFDYQGFSPVTAGLDTRYLLNARLAILLLPRQLVWALDDPSGTDTRPVFLDLPVGFGLQATPALYLEVDALLLRWGIRDTAGSSFIGGDFAPVQARLFWSPTNALDVGAGVAADLVAPGPDTVADTVTVLIQARYYGVD